jgi:hypothetical protein
MRYDHDIEWSRNRFAIRTTTLRAPKSWGIRKRFLNPFDVSFGARDFFFYDVSSFSLGNFAQ